MPFLFRQIRRETMLTQRVRQYFSYAVGEVLLIFVGITLALAFDDWSEQRRARRHEISALDDIVTNLYENIDWLTGTIERDSERLSSCRNAILIVERRSVWDPAFGELFDSCRYWTSPYFRTAAYDSLKATGTDLLTNVEVRASIVNLFEGSYAFLIGDLDREQWDFQSAVVLPVWNRYLRTVDGITTEPSDFDALLDSAEFLNVLYNRTELLGRSIAEQTESLADTQDVLRAISQELDLLRPE